MAYRELGVIEVREVLRRFCLGEGLRAIARGTGSDGKRPRVVTSWPMPTPLGISDTSRPTSSRCVGGASRISRGSSNRVALLAWELELGILSPLDQPSAAYHEGLRRVGAPERGEEKDGLPIVRVAILSDPFPVVALALVNPEALGQDGIAFLVGGERRHLDLEDRTLRLDPGMAKNEEGRVVYLTPELRTLLGEQLERVRDLERSRKLIVPWLPHLGPRLAGQRIRDFRRAWAEACTAARVPGAYRHDFRRTAVRNLGNAGVPERVAMTITGHKTRSVFDRYHIVSPRGSPGGRPAAGWA